MLPEQTFNDKIIDLASCLATRAGSTPESDHRNRTYFRSLIDLDPHDFTEACDRILYLDEWFPSIARIRVVADECRQDRARTRQAIGGEQEPDLVCPSCHGSRWVSYGGADPLKVQAGDPGSRVQRCPTCCDRDGVFLIGMERAAIRHFNGAKNPNGGAKVVDMDTVTWPARMDELRREDGSIDHEALYALSREMRGLDPTEDARPDAVAGFATIGRPAKRERRAA